MILLTLIILIPSVYAAWAPFRSCALGGTYGASYMYLTSAINTGIVDSFVDTYGSGTYYYGIAWCGTHKYRDYWPGLTSYTAKQSNPVPTPYIYPQQTSAWHNQLGVSSESAKCYKLYINVRANYDCAYPLPDWPMPGQNLYYRRSSINMNDVYGTHTITQSFAGYSGYSEVLFSINTYDNYVYYILDELYDALNSGGMLWDTYCYKCSSEDAWMANAASPDSHPDTGRCCTDGGTFNNPGTNNSCCYNAQPYTHGTFVPAYDRSCLNGVWSAPCQDNDGDGYGNPGQIDCTNGVQLDCNDANSNIFPGAEEICDGLDNDCDTIVDEDVTTTFYQDSDGDTFGNAASTTQACSAPMGYVSNNDDCDDLDENINPNIVEICEDSIDNNCDGLTDDEDVVACPLCQPTIGQNSNEYTCDDCIDNDCDGSTDGADSDCSCIKTQNSETSCSDGLDNDCDSYADSGDSDCGGTDECIFVSPPECVFWDECTAAGGLPGFYNLNCDCVPEPGTCTPNEDCIAISIYGDDCPGLCDSYSNCMDIMFDDCPAVTPECIDDFCLQGNGCAGKMDAQCNCIDVAGDNCPLYEKEAICGNGVYEPGLKEECDRFNFGGIKTCKEVPGKDYLSGSLRCNSTCQIAGCSTEVCIVDTSSNCPTNCGYTNNNGNLCYTDSNCAILCGESTLLDVDSENVITQKKIVIYNGKPIVVNIVVWE